MTSNDDDAVVKSIVGQVAIESNISDDNAENVISDGINVSITITNNELNVKDPDPGNRSKCEIVDSSSRTSRFNLSSKEGQEHLRELNEELKALNEDGNCMLSVIHLQTIEDTMNIMRKKHGGRRSGIKRKRVTTGIASESVRFRCRRTGSNSGPAKRTCHRGVVSGSKHFSSSDEDSDITCEDVIDIDNILEEKACKMNLSAVNVKNLLKYVITNEHVMSMVHNRMQADGVTDAVPYEPKLTRSRAKEMMEKQAQVPWPISPIKMPSPSRNKKLIEFEFSESDGSSDEEYKPEKECESDEDDSFVSSLNVGECGSRSVSGETESFTTMISTNDSLKSTGKPEDECDHVKVIECELQQQETEDTIALRTRSKLPLNDTPIEFIESNFIAPDITTDMYDSECDDEDWGNFLTEFLRPLGPDPNEANDDDLDPEYNFLEEEDVPDVEDLRNDRSVKISKKEIHHLMAELLEVAQEELNEAEEITDESFRLVTMEDTQNNSHTRDSDEPLFDVSRRQQLDEQMRKHVQLLTQVFILAADMGGVIPEKALCQTLLIELLTFASKSFTIYGGNSAFMAHNLKAAVDIVTNFDEKAVKDKIQNPKNKSGSFGSPNRVISTKAERIIAHSEVFIYPNLLPIAGFRKPGSYKKNFIEAEDNLLALGLEQFMAFKKAGVQSCWKLIKDNMLPTKTVEQIAIRTKNRRSNKAPNNAVKYYYQNGKAPSMSHAATHFDSLDVKPPMLQSVKLLPEFIRRYANRKRYKVISMRTVPPCNHHVKNESVEQQVASVTVETSDIDRNDNKKRARQLHKQENPSEKRGPEKVLVLPKTVAAMECLSSPKTTLLIGSPATVQKQSPLKQVSPIIKKYSPICLKKTGGNLKNQPRRILPKLPFVSRQEPRKLFPKLPITGSSTPLLTKMFPEVSSTESIISDMHTIAITGLTNASDSLGNDHTHSHLQKSAGSDQDSEVETYVDDVVDTAEDDCCVEMYADNEDDLAALMAASTTINATPKHRQHMIRKRKKSTEERDDLLALLEPNLLENDPLKDERANIFAHKYLQKVMDVVGEDVGIFNDFLHLLHNFNQTGGNVVDLYKSVCALLKDFPQLCEDFLVFLLPEQAMECGKFTEHLSLTRMQIFLRKLEVHFGKHPHHVQKILRLLHYLQQQDSLTLTQLKDAILPLLRGQTHLVEEFLQLFPGETPRQSQMVDFEELVLPDDDEIIVSDDCYEVVKLPETEDLYGTKDCTCECHNNSDESTLQNRLNHCIGCGIKFIDGRIFVQTGKHLKPCQVIYHNVRDHHIVAHDNAKHSQANNDRKHSNPILLLMSPTSSSSSLSPSILKDSDEEKDVNLMKEENNPSSATKTNDVTLGNVQIKCLLPDVRKDDVLTFDASTTNKALGSQKKDLNASCDDVSETSKEDACKKTVSLAMQELSVSMATQDCLASSESMKTNRSGQRQNLTNYWSRDLDRVLLQTCQERSPNKETFEHVAAKLKTKTSDEVEIRFEQLMKLFAENDKVEPSKQEVN